MTEALKNGILAVKEITKQAKKAGVVNKEDQKRIKQMIGMLNGALIQYGGESGKKSERRPASIEEVAEHMEAKLPSSIAWREAQKFWDFYESKGWLVGKTPMKRWKNSASLWAGRVFDGAQIPKPSNGGGNLGEMTKRLSKS